MQNNFINNTISIIINRIKRFSECENKFKFSEVETITLGEILTEEFISEFTSFSNFDQMIEISKLKNKYISYSNLFISSTWNDFVNRVTQFDSWDDLIKTAIKQYIFQKHGNKIY